MPEIVVASTTDEQRNIDAAAGIIEEPKEVTEGEEPEIEPASEAADKPESKSAVQKRIDKLTREKYEYKNKFETLEQRLSALETGKPAQKQEVAQPEVVEVAPKPTVDQFASYEEFTEALAEWKLDQKLAKLEAQKEEFKVKQTEQQKVQAVFDGYNKLVAEAMERYDDWDDVVGKATNIPEAVGLTIIEMENGPDVAYYLGKNPAVCKKLMSIGPLAAVAEIGKISAALMPTEDVEEDKETVRVPKVTTRAKEPIRPVSGSSTKSSVPLDELDYASFRRIRDKQEKEKYRR